LADPVVDNGLGGVVPGIVQAYERFRQYRKRIAARMRADHALSVLVQNRARLLAEIILDEGRVVAALAGGEAHDFALVLFEKAYRVVFRMALVEHETKAIFAHGEMHARDFAFDENVEPGCLELLTRNVVEAR